MKRADIKRGLWTVLPLVLGACVAPVEPGDENDGAQSDALSVCAAGATVKGVDTSYWQGAIDWAKVKASGQAFAIARVSDGLGYVDTNFPTDWPAIKAQGMVRGAYQFFRPAQDPVAQADLFLAKLNQYGALGAGDLPAILDVETVDGVAAATIRARMQTWLTRVQNATGKKPMIYTAAFMASTIGTGFSGYPLWVANYGVTCPSLPAGWTKWAIWQNGDHGLVPGVGGNVDTNVFNGTLADLQAFAGGSGGGGGVSWSCGGSAYNGQQYWTCSAGNLYECQGGTPVKTTCALGCLGEGVGHDDLCIGSDPAWSCNSSAYNGKQYWTCSGGKLHRCENGAPEVVACPAGCAVKPLGNDDVCN
jgi:lysozyme